LATTIFAGLHRLGNASLQNLEVLDAERLPGKAIEAGIDGRQDAGSGCGRGRDERAGGSDVGDRAVAVVEEAAARLEDAPRPFCRDMEQ
jgi:hypothetical protein